MSTIKVAPTLTLSNGYEIPVMGFGAYEMDLADCSAMVHEAIKLGYRLINTAFLYENEAVVGQALMIEFNAKRVKREDLFIVTKLWNPNPEPQAVRHGCELSLGALGLEYIDLYLMHFPTGKFKETDSSKIALIDTYKAMEKLVDAKLVRSLGTSNFDEMELEYLLKNCRIKPVTNQIDSHPMSNQLQLIEYCNSQDIVIMGYSKLTHVFEGKTKRAFYNDDRLKAIAMRYKKTSLQVMLRYLIEIHTVPIPKAVSKFQLREGFGVFNFKLTAEEVETMRQIITSINV